MLFDFAKDLLGIGSAAAGIYGVLGRRGKTAAEKQMGAQMERANQLTAALTDYSNPMRSQIREQQLQQARDARLEGTRDFLTAGMRMARRNPMGPAFISRNPRRDEALMRAMTLAGQNEAAQADAAARQEITGMLGGVSRSAEMASRAIPLEYGSQARRAGALPTALAAGRDFVGALERTFSPRYPDYGPNYGPSPGVNDPNRVQSPFSSPARSSYITNPSASFLRSR